MVCAHLIENVLGICTTRAHIKSHDKGLEVEPALLLGLEALSWRGALCQNPVLMLSFFPFCSYVVLHIPKSLKMCLNYHTANVGPSSIVFQQRKNCTHCTEWRFKRVLFFTLEPPSRLIQPCGMTNLKFAQSIRFQLIILTPTLKHG